MSPYLLLFLLLSPQSGTCNDDCPLSTSAGSCHCEEYDGGHDLWCPDRFQHKFRLHMKSGQLFIVCNPDFTPSLNGNDLRFQARDTNAGGLALESLLLESCPVLQESYARLVNMMNISSVKELILKHANSEEHVSLVAAQFSGINGLIALKIQNLLLASIDPAAFQGVPGLQTLSLVGNGLKTLPSDLLKSLTSLQELEVLETDLQQLPGDVFRDQGRLDHLKISANSLTALPAGLFSNLTSLTGLELIRINFLEGSIPSGLFDPLRNLKGLNVTGRGFELVAPNAFAQTSLERFDWSVYPCGSKNCTVMLNSGFLKNVTTLEYFGFSKSYQISSIVAEDFFQGCTNLREVFMFNSGLTSVPAELFKDATSLRKINMGHNKISQLDSITFRGLSRLEELILDSNRISINISIDLLQDLGRLRTFSIMSNDVQHIEVKAFYMLKKLETLNLANNSLSFGDESQPKWDSLTSLRIMNLAMNNITITSFTSWVSIPLDLQFLNLSYNHIGPIVDVRELNFQQNEIIVDLSFNDVIGLDFDMALKLPKGEAKESAPHRRNIILDGNPISCSCQALDLFKFVRGEFGPSTPVQSWFNVSTGGGGGGEAFTCHEPKELERVRFDQLSAGQLYCELTECPQPCSCRTVPALGRTEVDCHNKSLASFPAFVSPLGNKVVALDLCNNNISKLGDVRMVNFSAITELKLCGNDIEEVRSADLPLGLRIIDLADNKIRALSEDTVKFFQSYLEQVYLGGNSFTCDCKALPLFDFAAKNGHKIMDMENVTVTCDSVVKSIREWRREDLCYEVLDIILPVVFLLVVLVLIAVILCLRYKQPISIFMYSHKTIRRVCFMEDLEDRQYDAFISYSNEDADYVEQQLVRQLESGGRGGGLRYRCLVHSRDFDVGRPIVEQIQEAIDNSRRTVIVLSRNFVRSQWYEHEFSAAHSRKRVIVVVYGELPTQAEMGPLMWQYIQTNTYLAHNDPWFWDKLRYALPHRGRKYPLVTRRRDTIDEMILIENRGGGGGNGEDNPNFIFVQESPPNSVMSNGHAVTVTT